MTEVNENQSEDKLKGEENSIQDNLENHENSIQDEKKVEKKKPETQMFILYKNRKIESLFPIPVDAKLPKFQRTIGMAEGTIISADNRGKGIVEIDGIEYSMKDNRQKNTQKRFPLNRYIGKKIKFSFYPTITLKGIKTLNLKPTDKPFIKITNIRKTLDKQGAIEVIGNIKYIGKEHFTVSIWSQANKKEYLVNIFANLNKKAEVGDFVKADCVLKEGLIKLEALKIFPFKKIIS
jgi:hypothetical protein